MRRALLLVAVLAGCEREAPVGDGLAGWRVDTVPAFEIGTLEGDSAYQLFRVRDLVELPDGSIAIANSGTHEVRIYDAEGRYLRAFGRNGQGPGEFTALSGLDLLGDTIYTYDRAAARITKFLPDGTYLSDLPLHGGAGGFSLVFAGVQSDGSIAATASTGPGKMDGFTRDSMHLLRLSRDGLPLDTLGLFPGAERSVAVQQEGTQIMAMSIEVHDYFRNFYVAAEGEHIFAGPSDRPEVLIYGLGTRAVDTARWSTPPRPVDDAYLHAYLDREARKAETPEELQTVRDRMANAPRPPSLPFFDRILAGPDGELWVRLFADPEPATREWRIFGPDGSPRARLIVPAALDLRAIGKSRVYALVRDELEVEHVRALQLRR